MFICFTYGELTQGIDEAVQQDLWKPIVLCRGGPPSHLFFADDLILFAEATIDQIDIIKSILESFCARLEHKVNKDKTESFTLRMSPQALREVLAINLESHIQEILVNILVYPFFILGYLKTLFKMLLTKLEINLLLGMQADHLWQEFGGLGFRSSRIMNREFILKTTSLQRWG